MLSMAFKMTKVRKISPVQLFPSPSYPDLQVHSLMSEIKISSQCVF